MLLTRIQPYLKALLLIGIGLFLYSRIVNGTLYYYINERFAVLTALAVLGLLAVAISYPLRKQAAHADEAHDHEHDHKHHGHHHEHGAGHDHRLGWGGALLVMLPIVLGLIIPPQPLGSAALETRDMELALTKSALPKTIRLTSEKTATDKNLLDWWQDLQANPEGDALLGQEAALTGFVYHDARYGEDTFMLARFVVSCCVADATVVGLVVHWPDAPALANDQWVEVKGTFAPGQLEKWQAPILAAQTVTPVAIPQQPYLYP